ncbi:murein peptide amidase A [bacterium]|nr:murein peptide amidase A [bacterium]
MDFRFLGTPFLLFFYFSHFCLAATEDLSELCESELKKFSGPVHLESLKSACKKVKVLDGCQSVEGRQIFHYDKLGSSEKPQRILAKSLIHGDETPAGTVSRAWMSRLETISPRNSWRVIPIANPDGEKRKTRFNSRGVDLNRNFPTDDWKDEATDYWRQKQKSDPRRYPGSGPASEPETRCLVNHFEDFKPDFIISIHTPLGVLDFDGPKMNNLPRFSPLPWISLGNFPGSLGRYMWRDRKVPVLTIELKGEKDLKTLEEFDRLQDISGTVALQWKKLKGNSDK